MQHSEISAPTSWDLVLIGGGHSHSIVLKQWGANPLPGTRLTLISDTCHTPYSGMLPAHVAGFYRFEESHIDLRPLAEFAGAQFVADRAIGLDLQNRRVLCDRHPPIAFDFLSLDIGSTPTVDPELHPRAIPVKPVPLFLQAWNQTIAEMQRAKERVEPWCVGVVGGGIGGVELALSMQQRLRDLWQQAEIHLFHRNAELAPGHNRTTRDRLLRLLRDRGIRVHLGDGVEMLKAAERRTVVCCRSGSNVTCDRVFWTTHASAPPWIAAAGLATDDRGFLLVDNTLRSVSHPFVFAAGDVATMQNHPRPKAGVFAVRQGKPLYENLRRALRQQPLASFTPQRKYLTLIGTGTGKAIAARGSWCFGPSRLFWHWKDWVDRRFMERFQTFPEMSESADRQTSNPTAGQMKAMRCAGCGAKASGNVLQQALQRLQAERPEAFAAEGAIADLQAPDDAAVTRVPTGKWLAQTVDVFPSLVSDPFVFGQIAANHSLSDLWAVGAEPHSALAIATLPYASEAKQAETLYQILSGALEIFVREQTALVGGHTVEGPQLSLGFACNGWVDDRSFWRKGGAKPGDRLILTKPLGTGTLFAAHARYRADGRWIEAAIATMIRSNGPAARCLHRHGATACTDVTGFGFLGHLLEMLRASQVGAEIDLDRLPLLPGALATASAGFLSSLHPVNARAASAIANDKDFRDRAAYPLLFDPQTSGGLLAAVPAENAEACLTDLRSQPCPDACMVGTAIETPAKTSVDSANALSGTISEIVILESSATRRSQPGTP